MGRWHLNVLRRVKFFFFQISLTRFTLAFFLLSFTHCFAQGLIQAFLFNGDWNAQSLVSTIIDTGNVSTTQLPWLTKNSTGYELKLCTGVPFGLSPSEQHCRVVYPNSTVGSSTRRRETTEPQDAPIVPKGSQNGDMSMVPMTLATNGTIEGVVITFNRQTQNVALDQNCLEVLQYPLQVLRFSKNEEVALVGSQFWLLGISIFALVYQSIPHVVAVFCMRILSTGWSAYTIWRTKDVEMRFDHLLNTPHTACHFADSHFDLFPGYFQYRTAVQIPDLVLNVSALMFTAYFGWFLIRDFATHTFRFAGPPPKIVRLYRYLLAVSVCLQMSLYLFVTSASLWANQLLESPVSTVASYTKLYIAIFIATMVTFIPWMSIGWHAVKKEKTIPMMIFLAVSVFYVVGSAVMFHSKTYDWTYINWPFFASLTTASFVVFVAGTLLAVVVWINFNQGLATWLRVEEVLADTDFQPDTFTHDVENNKAPPLSPTTGGFKHDVNWSFSNDQNPPIYVVEQLHYGGRPSQAR